MRASIETESCLTKSENEEERERVMVEGVRTKGMNVLTMCSEKFYVCFRACRCAGLKCAVFDIGRRLVPLYVVSEWCMPNEGDSNTPRKSAKLNASSSELPHLILMLS